ncbi:branched-chain amino acid ABC transporter permease [Sphaerisporangium sp. NPDC004334]
MNDKASTRSISGAFDRVRDRWATAPGYQRWLVYLLVIVFALLLPNESIASFMSPDADWTTILFDPIGIYILLALGLNIVVGHAGLLDLGFVAFFAIGAYSLAYMGTKHGWSFWTCLILGIVLAAISGVILGGPTLRLRGDYLAIVTLGFGEIVRIVALNTNEIGGAQGIFGIPTPPPIGGLEFSIANPVSYYYLVVAMITLVVVISRQLEKSRVGRAWTAIREDEDAAELMGVPTFKFKLLAFFIGASIGGFAGVAEAAKINYIQPQNFPFLLSATILVCVVFGGPGNIPGVIVGAFLIAWLPERFREFHDYRYMIFGAVLVIMMILRPEGLIPSRRRRAEMAEGSGGMGSMGGEVAGPDAPIEAEVAK